MRRSTRMMFIRNSTKQLLIVLTFLIILLEKLVHTKAKSLQHMTDSANNLVL